MRILLYSAFFAFLISASGCNAEQGALEDTLPDVYTLTTEATPDTGGSISPSEGEYITGQSIQIEARPSEGYIFDYWEGDLSGNKNPDELIFSGNRSVTAHFTERDYDLNIAIEGEGSVRETVIERSAFVVVSLAAEADSGWIFDRWEGDLTGSDNPETITIEDEVKSVTAVFVEDVAGEYTLSVSVEGEGTVTKNPDKNSYTDGDEVELTAQPASGWSFSKWEGALSGSNSTRTVVMDKDKSVTAIFVEDIAGEYTLSVTVDGEGSVSKDPNKNSYTDGEEVELTAQPASGWNFSKWEGALSGSNNPVSIVMDQDKSIKAIFVEDVAGEYTLSVTVDGEGSVSKDPNKNSYTDGEEVELTARPASGWSFSKWEGALSGSDNPESIVMDQDKSIKAIFVEDVAGEYTLSVTVDGEGSVSKDPNKNSYTDGEEVELTARPASGWRFSKWEGALSGSNNPESIVMDQDKSIKAIFVEDVAEEYTLSVTVDGEGSVSKDPNKNSYTDGEEVELTARPASGWRFSKWEGALSGSNSTRTVVMDQNKSVTAVFVEDIPEEYTLSVSVEGEGSVSKAPNRSTYTDGEVVELTAQPASGWSFSKWNGALSGSSNPETIVVDQDKSVTAVFEQDAVTGIDIDEVKIYIDEMKMDGARRTNDFNTSNYILNLPLDGTRFRITHTEIPAGFYDEIELEIEKPDENEDVDDPDFKSGSDRYSLVVKGAYDGQQFTFRSKDDFEISVDLRPHLEITEGQNRVIAIGIDFEEWFRDSNGEILDPSDSRNREQINENIEDSFSDFEDEF